LYGFSLAYLVAPTSFDSAHVVEFVAGLPDAVKYTGKAILALPFTYHSFNGLRHIAWDMGKCAFFPFRVPRPPSDVEALLDTVITVRGAYASGYAVLGATFVSTIALVVM
jgi:succinate dehydrogenase (ubiquinone) cytochrome b560 subunit